MRYWLCLCMMAGSILFGFAQNNNSTHIEGTADFAKNTLIEFQIYTDYITGNKQTIASAILDSNGRFNVELKIAYTQPVQIYIHNAVAEFFVESGKNYQFRLLMDKNYAQLLDPASYNRYIQIVPLKMDTSDINYKINRLEQVVSVFVREHERLLLETKDSYQYDSLKNRLFIRLSIDTAREDFYNIYATYLWATIDMMMYDKDMNMFYDHYFNREIIEYTHPMFMMMFNNFYENYIHKSPYIAPGKIWEIINRNPEYLPLFNELGKDRNLINERIREMVILKMLGELYEEEDYSKDNIIYLIEGIQYYSKFPEHQEMAKQLIIKLKKENRQKTLSDMIAKTKNGNMSDFVSKKGKYVYVQFYNVNCEECIRDMMIMKKLYQIYKDSIDFISVSLDNDMGTFIKFTETYSDFNWDFWNFNGNYHFLRMLEVNALPRSILLNRDGAIELYEAPDPSRNLQGFLEILFPEKEIKQDENITSPSKKRKN